MVSINLEAFTLWESFGKIICEGEDETLIIINTLKKKYKNKLGKNVIFFIFDQENIKKIKKVINYTCKNELNIVQFTWWW